MADRIPLPDELRGRSFTREQAAQAGITQGRLRRKDITRPFHGVQSTDVPASALERCRAYAVKLKPGQFFSHQTAARLHGLTLPSDDDEAVLHVGAIRPADAPHSRGVRGHRLLDAGEPWQVGGLPIPDPLEVLCQLGADLSFEDLVIVADELMNRSVLDEEAVRELMRGRVAAVRRIGGHAPPCRPRLPPGKPLARGDAHPADARRCGHPRRGAERTDRGDRHPPLPRSSRLRLACAARRARVRGRAAPADKRQFRYDIVRYDDLAADGWRVIRATGDHLTRAGRLDLVRRVRSALAAAP